MSAPVLWADISRHAWTIGAMIVIDVLSFRLKMRAMKLNRFWRMPIICKNRLISGWKTIIRAMTPTLTNCPRMLESSSMLSVRTTTHIR